MGNSARGRPTMERRATRPRVVVAIIVVLAVIGLVAGNACGGAAPVAQWPRGGEPGIPGVKGVIELLLFDSGSGETMFLAMGMAAGDGLTDNTLYSLWLAKQDGNVFLIDTARADEECEEDPDTGEESDECELEVHLRSTVQASPMQITSLLGLTATIREGSGRMGPQALEQAPVVMTFTVTEADL